MRYSVDINNLTEQDLKYVGSKAYALSVLLKHGFDVPKAACITTRAYEFYVKTTGLAERISMELSRKDFHNMRWEELWDASLRIRNMFLNTAMPAKLVNELKQPLEKLFRSSSVAVRSSAPGEDSTRASFAGLHESYMNVQGVYAILDHIRLVWASLWSDAALLYRRELGLDVHQSTMAVLVQELIIGDRSGVIFGRNPSDESQVVIEAIYGLNQGLVDGTVEPDRWNLDRASGRIISHEPAKRLKRLVPAKSGIVLENLPGGMKRKPPLGKDEVKRIYELAMRAEQIFGSSQDVEWTFRDKDLYTLQSRPITTLGKGNVTDDRSWYRSLSRSFENLKLLRSKIEGELVPEMIAEADRLSEEHLARLPDDELARKIEERMNIFHDWEKAYWKYFIPFAHGMRLFGRVYNDTVRPHDPYEFMDLLRSSTMLSIKRNHMLEDMAGEVRKHKNLEDALREGKDTSAFVRFSTLIGTFVDTFGDLTCYSAQCAHGDGAVRKIVLEMASRPPGEEVVHLKNIERLEDYYFSFFPEEKIPFATDLLDLARASYRLRDDDNIYLGRIKGLLLDAIEEGKHRIELRGSHLPNGLANEDVVKALRDPGYIPSGSNEELSDGQSYQLRMRARQLIGQPAGSGIATGKARVFVDGFTLTDFKAGEILVCDSLDPNMTFIIPLASGIVERRGGMLIHGAIIAREYGLPCVTGVPDAIHLIRTGDHITVDGYLGIVVIS
ncbi:MAG: PEP/pyruvate-binding domain-containing protein [Desulfomonilia bacterium]